ncbi:hypothetical protein Nepgr_000367 [Nepenthes gracilis]|uniref:Uncharacterized protein n=1 Tax=Nepenthes gracilis TaxID=150966 RepID=A0AAD3P3F0_NEPGR|nr:hypothetical protein Nepgr_000367 [Nepenthes gracilis]
MIGFGKKCLTAVYSLTAIQGSRGANKGEVIVQSFGEERLCFRMFQRYTAATPEHGMHPPISSKPEGHELMDEMAIVATEEHRSIIFQEPYCLIASSEFENPEYLST